MTTAARLARALLPVVHHPLYSAPQLPAGHRFPMAVFQRIHDRLLASGIVAPSQIVHPTDPSPSADILHLAHCPDYLAAFEAGALDPGRLRRIGFGAVTCQPDLIARTKAEVAGTLLTAELALERGLAVNTAGGTHHAHRDHGSGFCILNDMAVTTEYLLAAGKGVHRVLIVDLDVHQGDGTAALFPASRQEVYTLSIHAANNFPARKRASTVDIALPDGTGDDEYLAVAASALTAALTSHRPDLVIYDAGVDVHASDSLGRLALTDDGLRRRDLLVLDTCVGYGVPVAGLVGGGYANDLDILADRHCWLHRAAMEVWEGHGLGN